MLVMIILLILFLLLLQTAFVITAEIVCRLRTNQLLFTVSTKRDLMFLKLRDFENIVAEIFRRMDHQVEFSDSFGEGGNGLVIDKKVYVLLEKNAIASKINVEQAKKLVKSMQRDSIHRGMFVALGDFDAITVGFCHKNVVTCINGDKLLEMCRQVQALKKGLPDVGHHFP